MVVLLNFTRLFSFCSLFIVFVLSVQGADVCVKRSACSCVFSNGTGIDLSPSAKNLVYESKNIYEEKKINNTEQIVLSTYYYHPCFDVLMKINGSAPSTCGVALALCRHTLTYNGNATMPGTLVKHDEAFDLLGTSNVTTDTPGVEFAQDGSYIKYLHNPSFSFVNLICSETDDEFYVKDLSDPNNLQLDFFSRNACLRQLESSRSVGSTLLIIFFSFVIFYLVLGVCTKKFLMGATGIEVIPNLMFWTELPNLVKDGWAFARSGFKLPARGPGPTTSPDPNSYDSI